MCIISTAQQARPNVIGQMDEVCAQLISLSRVAKANSEISSMLSKGIPAGFPSLSNEVSSIFSFGLKYIDFGTKLTVSVWLEGGGGLVVEYERVEVLRIGKGILEVFPNEVAFKLRISGKRNRRVANILTTKVFHSKLVALNMLELAISKNLLSVLTLT
jgi:hypothetical protein